MSKRDKFVQATTGLDLQGIIDNMPASMGEDEEGYSWGFRWVFYAQDLNHDWTTFLGSQDANTLTDLSGDMVEAFARNRVKDLLKHHRAQAQRQCECCHQALPDEQLSYLREVRMSLESWSDAENGPALEVLKRHDITL